MYSYGKRFSSVKEVLKFTYPKLHTKKSWYIDFLSYDPAAGKMRRKKYMLDSIPKITDRRKRASELIEALTRQLRSGWSPWVNVEDSRGYTLLSDALDRYASSLERLPKYKTRKSYGSRLNVLREYIGSLVLPPRYVYQYDTAFVTEFLDWIHLDRECSARTRNNYRGWCSSLAAFFMERQYIATNPVEPIRTLSEAEKKRKPLTAVMLKAMQRYLYENDKMFLLACMMEYYTFIRPEELTHVKIGDISVKEQSVFIPASVSKNKRDGKVGLNDKIIKLMLELGVLSHHNDCYLFGDNMCVCEKRGSSEQFRRQWKKLRKTMKWGDEYQFYSLKDSGIRDLANSDGIVIARDQARHTDVSTTNKYLQGHDLPVHEETKKFNGAL
jgi:integrase